MKLGLCLAGGGVKGAAHIGAIKAFEEEKINFNFISGTSSGSIVATLYSIGYTPDEIYKLFKKYCKKIKYVDTKNILKAIYGLVFKRKIIIDGFNSGDIIEKIINEACKEKGIIKIKDIKIPLLIPSVNLYNGEIYIFSSMQNRAKFSDQYTYISDAPIGKVVRASCSYPGVFSPCKYKDIELIDGGIRENVPWKETKLQGADKVISVIFENELKEKCCNNVIEVASRSIEILCHELSNYELDGADYLLKIKSNNIKLLDVDKIDELYYQGYVQTKEKIEEIKYNFKLK